MAFVVPSWGDSGGSDYAYVVAASPSGVRASGGGVVAAAAKGEKKKSQQQRQLLQEDMLDGKALESLMRRGNKPVRGDKKAAAATPTAMGCPASETGLGDVAAETNRKKKKRKHGRQHDSGGDFGTSEAAPPEKRRHQLQPIVASKKQPESGALSDEPFKDRKRTRNKFKLDGKAPPAGNELVSVGKAGRCEMDDSQTLHAMVGGPEKPEKKKKKSKNKFKQAEDSETTAGEADEQVPSLGGTGREPPAGPLRGGHADGRQVPAPTQTAAGGEVRGRFGQTTRQKGSGSKGKGLLDQMRMKLQGGHFRWLNEQLYTQPGRDSFEMMKQEPELFKQYHEGFRQQANQWPKLPVDVAIKWLKGKPSSLTVVDFGCGDAKLGQSVKQKVHSLDLVATAPGVIACDMANTPLENKCADVAVFCLALMGTNYPSFIREAHRVLKPGGTVWIAEVRSRFAEHASRTETQGMQQFVAALKKVGFVLRNKDASNRMFVILELTKSKADAPDASAKEPQWPSLAACTYKRR